MLKMVHFNKSRSQSIKISIKKTMLNKSKMRKYLQKEGEVLHMDCAKFTVVLLCCCIECGSIYIYALALVLRK